MMGIPFPEEYGGAGADTLAYALTVEELARVDSSVAITLCAHTSLGTQPIYLFGSGGAEARVAAAPHRRRDPRRLRPDRAGRRLRRRQPSRRARPRGRRLGDRRRQAVHHERRHRDLRGRLDHGGHRRAETARREISNLLVANGTPGLEVGEPYRKLGWNASDTRPLAFAGCRVPEANLLGERGARAFASSSRCSTSAGSAWPRWASGLRRAPSTRRSPTRKQRAGVRAPDLEVPGDPGEARRHVDRDRGGAAPHLQGGAG